MMKWSSRLIKSTIELLAVALLVFDLLLWKIGILAATSLAYFVLDFVRYRREAVLNYRASRSLREGMTLADIRSIERKYSLSDNFNSFEKHASARTPLDRYFYFAKYERVRGLLLSYGSQRGRWLDMGCGFGEDTFYVAQYLSPKVIGLELDEIKLLGARKIVQEQDRFPQVAFCVGDAINPPFRTETFDTILMTEVLEHLIDPEKGIRTCQTLLKREGVFIVSTQSSHNLGYTLNPVSILEKSVSLLEDKVLPPHHGLHARFEYDRKRPEPEYGIHYHFSQRELRRMIARSGFRILWEGTFEIEIFPYLFVELFSNGNIDRIKKIIDPLETILERTPLVNRFGQHLLLVAQKRSS
ncbi:MAG: class I SAM-dependent methyltransferase [Thermodesulfobacteriota bacterium]